MFRFRRRFCSRLRLVCRSGSRFRSGFRSRTYDSPMSVYGCDGLAAPKTVHGDIGVLSLREQFFGYGCVGGFDGGFWERRRNGVVIGVRIRSRWRWFLCR